MIQTIKILTSSVVVALFINEALSKNTKFEKVAAISFEIEVIDYDIIIQKSDGKRIFTFTKSGDVPLVITNVKPSSGCTVPSFSKTSILPKNKENYYKIPYKQSWKIY